MTGMATKQEEADKKNRKRKTRKKEAGQSKVKRRKCRAGHQTAKETGRKNRGLRKNGQKSKC